MNKIRSGDEVIAIAGRDKGKRGKVLQRVDDSKLLVEGINLDGFLPVQNLCPTSLRLKLNALLSMTAIGRKPPHANITMPPRTG